MAAADDAYKKAQKNLDDLINKQKTLNKSAEELNNNWNIISSQLFKLDQVSFFKDVKKSPEDVKAIGAAINKLQGEFKILGNEFAKSIDASTKATILKNSLTGAFEAAKIASSTFGKETLKGIEDARIAQENFQKKLTIHWDEIKAHNTEMATVSDDVAKSVLEQIASGKKYEDILLTTGDAGRAILASMTENKEVSLDLAKKMGLAADSVEDLKKSASETTKEFVGTKEAALQMAKNIGKNIMSSMVSSLTKFDDVLYDVQKNTGVVMNTLEHSRAFSNLTTQVAQFGVSVEDAGKLMSDMSTELNTTNFSVLATAAKDFAAIEGATGAASADIADLAGNLMRMGESSGQVKDFMQGADQDARKFGVSSKRVLESISKNMTRMRTMGFVGGEDSLKKMAIQAEKLHMSVNSIFDMAEHARNIEGAMEMASELQLAGGSFANINPMDLLAAARKGPAELQKILTSMGKDIGKFNENGEYTFDPIDADRLKIAADAAHVPVDEFQKMIAQNATDSAKLNPFQGTLDGIKDADKDLAKSTLSDMLKRGADGQISIDVDSDMAKKMGITELAQITPDMMNKILEQKELDAKTLEQQAKNNLSFNKTMESLKNSFMSIFSMFQPALEVLSGAMQWLSGMIAELGPWGKTFLAGLTIALLMFKTSAGDLVKGLAGGIGKAAGGIKNKITGAIGGGSVSGDVDTEKGLGMAKTWDGIKNSISKVATGIKDSIGGIFNFIKDISGQILGFVGDIINQILDLATRIVDGLATVLESASKAIGVVQKIVSQLVSIVTKSFISLMSALGEGITAFASAAAVGLGILTPFIPIILVLTVAIIGLAFAFKLFAEGLASLAPLITSVFNGIATVVLAVGTAVSMVISTIADSIVKLSNIDAMNLFALAAGLGVLSVAMIAFGAASAIGGVMSFFGGGMFSQLSELALLAPAIKILGDSLNSAGDGLAKLSAAAESLSLDKLNKLKELSDSMAGANAGGAAMAAMANVANTSGGAGGGEKTIKVEVELKLNGRTIQNILTDGKVGSTHNV